MDKIWNLELYKECVCCLFHFGAKKMRNVPFFICSNSCLFTHINNTFWVVATRLNRKIWWQLKNKHGKTFGQKRKKKKLELLHFDTSRQNKILKKLLKMLDLLFCFQNSIYFFYFFALGTFYFIFIKGTCTCAINLFLFSNSDKFPNVHHRVYATVARTLHWICQNFTVAQRKAFWRYAEICRASV